MTTGRAWEDSRWKLREQAEGQGGTTCPMCDQHVQVYRRKINAGMARSLITMYRLARQYGPNGEYLHRDGWIHVPTEVGARSREEGKLAYWRLLEEATEKREDGGRAGWWRLTTLGRQYVRHGLAVPKYLLIYNDRVIEPWGLETATIRDALGTRFNYDDLMRGV